ncbi:hypothetical protein [Streptomyces milbemycinicus]|uniref:hypothetical protein n=1 Tax=Streptomyces milbemycinicus TaxID=476552 RepID=UPI0033FB2D26
MHADVAHSWSLKELADISHMSRQVARDTLAEWRAQSQVHLRDRFQRAVAEGDLPADADPELTARYVMTIANDMAVQAAGGAASEDLQRVADAALRNWPPS